MDYSLDRYYVMPMNRDPTVTDDVTMGCHCGTRWVNYMTKRAFTCTDASAGTAVWGQTTVPSSRFETITIPFTTSSTSYVVAHSIPYVGSDIAPLKSIRIIAALSGGAVGVTFDLRVRDISNGMTVAQALGLRSLTKAYFSMGTLSNYSAEQAIFDIEVRRSGTASSDSVTLYSMIIEFV